MDLNYKTFGQGEPLLILHGLFGTLDNWQTLGKQLADHYTVYLIDQRNHGRSPHVEDMNYPAMASDLKEFMEANWIYGAHILGHSMGGKTAMQFAGQYPDMVEKLIVVDIAPRAYPGGHEEIMEALRSVDLQAVDQRSEADEQLKSSIKNKSIRQFLLKNLSRTKQGDYAWKMNLDAIYEHYEEILAAISGTTPFEGPALFIRGENSDYIQEEDREQIKALFPKAEIKTVENAGHWVHAEQPERMLELVREFLG